MIWQEILLIFVIFLVKSCTSDKLKNDEDLINKCDEFYSWKYWFNATHQLKVFEMQDASARNALPTGLLQGNIFDLGNFDECYSTKDIFLSEDYYGKYCLGTLTFDAIEHLLPQSNEIDFEILNVGNDTLGLHYGYCLPDFCTLEDFEKRSFLGKVTIHPKYCYSKRIEESLSSGAIATISLISFFLFIVLISSVYEVFLNHKKDNNGNPKKPAHELLLAFSAIRNWPKIFQASHKKDQLLCLNGMKAISMIWIIYYHEYQNHIMSIWNNASGIQDYINDWKNMYILQGTVAVDTFFAVGGLVLTYTFMKSAKRGDKYNPFMTYIHRYFRLTPVVAILVLIHIFLLKYLGHGPLFHYVYEFLVQQCEQYWWSALLYIQTYTNTINNCVPQSWYLSVDMQLFILAPIILIPLKKWPKPTFIFMTILVILQMIIVFVITYNNDFPASGYVIHPKADDYQSTVYFQTYARYGPYIIGMMTGYVIFQIKMKNLRLKLNPIVVTILWPTILVILLGILYGASDIAQEEKRVLEHAFFNAFFRVSWAVCICVTAILCIADYGGPINTFLSLPIFQVISNLSYCMYLVHYPIVIVRIARKTNQFSYGNGILAFEFWGDFAMSFVLSVICSLTFEIPFISVEKYLVQGVRSVFKKDEKKQVEN